MTSSTFPPWVTDVATAITIITFLTGIVTLPQLFEGRGNFLRLMALAGCLVVAVLLMRPVAETTAGRDVFTAVPHGGTQPVEIHRPAPQYPPSAQRAGVQGIVVLRGIVRADGTIRSVEVMRSLERTLDEAALRAVRQWRFRPAMYLGKPIDVQYTVTVRFRLHGSS